jgi:hypothetical protein
MRLIMVISPVKAARTENCALQRDHRHQATFVQPEKRACANPNNMAL